MRGGQGGWGELKYLVLWEFVLYPWERDMASCIETLSLGVEGKT